MQFHQAPHSQLPLFEAFLAQPIAPLLTDAVETPWSDEPEPFSELSLRGAAGTASIFLRPSFGN